MRMVVTRMVVRMVTICPRRSGARFGDRSDGSQRGRHGNCYSESTHAYSPVVPKFRPRARQTKQRSLIAPAGPADSESKA